MAIKTFARPEVSALFSGSPLRRLPADMQRTALRKLLQLHAASELAFLRIPPGNRLDALQGDRWGQHSIRINAQLHLAGRQCLPGRYRGLPLMEADDMDDTSLAPVHPGEILMEDFLKPLGISQYALAKAIAVPPRRINEIVHGKRAISADTALRLGRYFDVRPDSWMNLQAHFDLELAARALGDRLLHEIRPRIA